MKRLYCTSAVECGDASSLDYEGSQRSLSFWRAQGIDIAEVASECP